MSTTIPDTDRRHMRRLGKHRIVPMPVANEERGAGVVPEGPATSQEVEPSVAGGPTVEGSLEAPSSLEVVGPLVPDDTSQPLTSAQRRRARRGIPGPSACSFLQDQIRKFALEMLRGGLNISTTKHIFSQWCDQNQHKTTLSTGVSNARFNNQTELVRASVELSVEYLSCLLLLVGCRHVCLVAIRRVYGKSSDTTGFYSKTQSSVTRVPVLAPSKSWKRLEKKLLNGRK